MAGTPWSNQMVNLIILTEDTSGFSGIFGYNPEPGTGNLVFSVAAKAGTDPYNNAYPAGVSATAGYFSSGPTAGFSGTDFTLNNQGLFFYGV